MMLQMDIENYTNIQEIAVKSYKLDHLYEDQRIRYHFIAKFLESRFNKDSLILDAGAGTLVCCGQDMNLVE